MYDDEIEQRLKEKEKDRCEPDPSRINHKAHHALEAKQWRKRCDLGHRWALNGIRSKRSYYGEAKEPPNEEDGGGESEALRGEREGRVKGNGNSACVSCEL